MSGALSALVGIMVASVVPMEALLFVAGDEQQSNTDCAQAVVESIAAQFWHHPVAAPRDSETGSDPETDDFSMSVAEIHELLSVNEIPNRAFWMSWEDVVTITADYGPVIVHFGEPTGHYAVSVGGVHGTGRSSGTRRTGPLPVYHMLIADPARGDIIVSRAWWRRHASGATVVVDTEWDRYARDKHVEVARKRLRRLELARDEL
jgi:hypothetical protein